MNNQKQKKNDCIVLRGEIGKITEKCANKWNEDSCLLFRPAQEWHRQVQTSFGPIKIILAEKLLQNHPKKGIDKYDLRIFVMTDFNDAVMIISLII